MSQHIATSGDPFEFGSAGRWISAIGQLINSNSSRTSRFRTAGAVAIGIALDVTYSRRMEYLDAPSAERILRLLEELGFELFTPELMLTGAEATALGAVRD